MITKLFGVLAFTVFGVQMSFAAEPAAVPKFELKPDDHIALIGNALADRFQHSGWLETFIYSKYPNHNLVFRNLAVAGDEVSIRHRPENFGSADEWLNRAKADVILAFSVLTSRSKGRMGCLDLRRIWIGS